jgi:Protein of unknown function (DUF3305)
MPDSTAPKSLSIPLGVTIARETIENPWQDHIWRAVSVFTGAEPVDRWRMLEQRPGYEHFHAATLPLELHRKETPGYIANLLSDTPGIYVIIRNGAALHDGLEPVHVALITASAHDVEAYGHLGEEVIGTVAMPEAVRELLEAFIDAHHVDEPFKKRKRRPHLVAAEHQFGQEPIHVLRERMRKAGSEPA